MKKKLVSLLLAAAILFSMALLPSSAAAPAGGISFTGEDGYATALALSAAPRTIEAWIKVDATASAERLGIIVGNYGSDGTQLDLEIRKNGNPYLFWKPEGETSVTANFSNVDLRTGEWLHLAVVSTETDAKCYINGELKQTVEKTFNDFSASTLSSFMVGGDYRSGNSQYLKSTTVGSLALYSDSRTATQIAADYAAANYTESTLLCAYDFSIGGNGRLKDYSAKANHLVYTNTANPSLNETFLEMREGMMFDNINGTYRIEDALTAAPHTIEAEVYFPAAYDPSARGGAILGNYMGSGNSCINLEVYTEGQIRYYWRDANDDDFAAYFNADIYRGEWMKIAVTHDYEAGVVKGYVNGELIGTVTDKNVGGGPARFDGLVLGGDSRSGNEQYFKGNLKSVAVYSDIRTDAEIAADTVAYGKDDLILHYDLSGYKYNDRPATVSDSSTYGNDAIYERTWLDSETIETDYAYSFAVVGDTQKLNYYYPDEFHKLYDWIVANKESKNIQFVFGLGDITEVSNTDEWDRAIAGFDSLSDAGIPYSVVRGNHDKQSVTVDTKKTFNQALIGTKYDDEIAANRMTEGELENSYRTFTVGEEKFLSITLDYGPTDAELAWASSVCEAHPDHKVIVTTHAYMFRDGTTLDSGDVVPPSNSDPNNNDGDDMWEKFVKLHENIVLVMSGHDPSAYVVTRKDIGVHGNTVTQMLIDAQTEENNRGAMGMVTMFYFSKDGKTVEVEHYSTVRDQYFLQENQFTMTWNEMAGDMDHNYTINLKDVLLSLQAILDNAPLDRADVNGDGKISLLDVLQILKKLV